MTRKVYGPYIRDDGRMHVIIYENGKRTTQSYPRYLYEEFYKIKLNPWEDVHHKDEDINNNDIGNLEKISTHDHMSKHSGRTYTKCQCPECDRSFEIETRIVTRNIKIKRDGPFCSRECAGKWNGRKRKY